MRSACCLQITKKKKGQKGEWVWCLCPLPIFLWIYYCERYDQWKDFHLPPPYTVKCWSKRHLFSAFLWPCRLNYAHSVVVFPNCQRFIDHQNVIVLLTLISYDLCMTLTPPQCSEILSFCFLLNGALLQQNCSSIWTTLSAITSRLLGKKR